jgi:virginiamycin B lyase
VALDRVTREVRNHTALRQTDPGMQDLAPDANRPTRSRAGDILRTVALASVAACTSPPVAGAPLPYTGAVVVADLGSGSFPLDAVLEPDGSALWVTDRAGGGVYRIDARTGENRRYPSPPGAASPYGIARGTDGAIWYAAHRGGMLVRLDPVTGESVPLPLSALAIRPMFIGVTSSRVWFTSRGAETFGAMDTSGGSGVDPGGQLPGTDTYALLAAEDGSVWVSSFTESWIARVDPTYGRTRMYTLPGHRATARRMALGPDGRLWYSATHRGTIGVIDPLSDEVVEHELGVDGARPYGIAVGPDGRIWVGDAAADRAIGWDPRTGRSITVDLRSDGAVPRTLVSDPVNGFLWVVLGEAGRVARIEFPVSRQ